MKLKKVLGILGVIFVVAVSVFFFLIDKSSKSDMEIPPVVNTDADKPNVIPNGNLYSDGENGEEPEQSVEEEKPLVEEEKPVVDSNNVVSSDNLYVEEEGEGEDAGSDTLILSEEEFEPELSTTEQGLFNIELEFENAITFYLSGADELLDGTYTDELKSFRESVNEEYPYTEFPKNVWMQDGGGDFEKGTYYIVWEGERYDFTFTVKDNKLDTITYMPVEG